MEGLSWSDPEIPLAANVSGAVLTKAADIRQALIDQIASPVRWAACVSSLIKSGCTSFLEVGPGRVLSALVRQIDREVSVSAADSPAKLSEFLKSRAV